MSLETWACHEMMVVETLGMGMMEMMLGVEMMVVEVVIVVGW